MWSNAGTRSYQRKLLGVRFKANGSCCLWYHPLSKDTADSKSSCGFKGRLNRYMKKNSVGDCSIKGKLSDSGNSNNEVLTCSKRFYASIYNQERLCFKIHESLVWPSLGRFICLCYTLLESDQIILYVSHNQISREMNCCTNNLKVKKNSS